jgi:excinuclease ABC subunit C
MKPTEISYLPTDPGCYIYKDAKGTVLYVGKAKNIKKRVSSYFQKKELDPKTSLLVANIIDIDTIVTKTEVEALILENSLIKRYQPKYNLDLKDSRKYAYILLHDDADFPWIEVVRSKEGEGEFYGPFVSGSIRKLVTDVLSRHFRILTSKASPQLKKAMNKEAYAERVQQARQILKGHVDSLIRELERQMHLSSTKTHYEYALTLRNQISALKTLKDKQIIEMTRAVDANIINYQISGDDVYLLVFSIRKGVLEGKQSFTFPYYEEFLDDFLLQYYDQSPVPHEIILPHEIDAAIPGYLKSKYGRTVEIVVPLKGDKKELLDLVSLNINTTFFAGNQRMNALKSLLGLEHNPKVIDCFDISHLGGTNVVASMVSFTNGLPDKSRYRKFKIVVNVNDDYSAMREVIRRRYAGSLSKSMASPDLIVVDGGPGQLSSALSVLNELRIKIPVISLAKQFEEIYISSNKGPVRASHKDKGLQLLQAIRDEAHRFAITYQRLLRDKEIFKR